MALTDTAIKAAKPKEKPYKLSDEKGMYLLIKPNGSKYWHLDYRFANKRKTLALGVYPEVTLKEARAKTSEARTRIRANIDPMALRKVQKATASINASNNFEAISEEWLLKQKSKWSESHLNKVRSILKNNLYPWIGSRPICEITAPELLGTLRRTEARGTIETAHRAKQIAGQVFRYAIATGRAERDYTQDLKGALETPITKHNASITDPKAVSELLVKISAYRGTPVVQSALYLHALLFQRPGEIRQMLWKDVDLDAGEWRYVISKTNTPHIVPLPVQAINILNQLKPLTGRSEYVFPSARSLKRPLSENAVRVALRTMGYDNDMMTAHGFRAMARTVLDEVLNIRVDYIEHQLGHAVKDANGRAYNRTSHLDARKEMMQRWADYLDALKANFNT
jgi:integrase